MASSKTVISIFDHDRESEMAIWTRAF